MKKYILFVLVFLLFVLSSCEKTNNESFNRDNPSPIIVNIEGDLKEITVKGKDINDTVTEFEGILKNGNVILGSLFFANYENGNYQITIKAGKKVNLTVELSGTNYDFDMIKKQNVFSQRGERYYVLFSREGCSGCEQLRPDLITFNNFLSTYPDGAVNKLYVVDYSDPDFEASKGEGTNYIGISTYDELINNVSISTPTLMVIDKGAVLEYYIGASNISSFFYIEMANIKQEVIIHTVEDPKVISVDLDFTPTKYIVTSEADVNYTYRVNEYEEGKTGFDGTTMFFTKNFFNQYVPGIYTVLLYDASGHEKTFKVISQSTFRIIKIEDIFEQEEEAYYVFFLRDDCSGCAAVKPTLLKYAKYYDLYDNGENYPIYAIHRSMNNSTYIGNPEFFVGAKEYTEIRLGYYPRVVLVKNHEIVELYKNEGNGILTHFRELMSKLK